MSQATGYLPRNYSRNPIGSIPYCVPFDLPLIPRDEWKDRIDDLKDKKARLTDILDQLQILADDQNGFGYCWSYGTVQAFILTRAIMGLPYRKLNPHALAAQVMQFRDRGGNTFDAIPWLVEKGCPTYDTWPQWSMDRSLATSKAVKEESVKYRLTEHYELDPNNLDQKMTLLLGGAGQPTPVIAGYLDIGHMMCDLDAVYRINGSSIEYGVDSLNSWGATSGPLKNGRVLRWGSKAKSFDQAAPRLSTSN